MKEISSARRILYLVLGFFFTGLGIVGIVTPILPTTIFLILASGFFVNSSPGLHRWLNNSRITGPYIRAYTQKQGLSRSRKIFTIAVLWTGLSISGWIVRDILWLVALLGVIGIAVTIHIATIRPAVIPKEKQISS